MQYIALIHRNADTTPTAAEWDPFFGVAPAIPRTTARTTDRCRSPALAAVFVCLVSLWCRAGLADDAPRGDAAPLAFLGVATCANASCHGNAESRDPRIWKRSYWLWAQHDRHRRAFEVLFAPRSVGMVERLTASGDSRLASVPQETPTAAADSYLRVLEDRCIGCHATTPPGASTVTAASAASVRRQANEYADGVSCESCHGAAEKWSSAHVGVDWNKLSNLEKLTQFGFTSTKPLARRAAVCVDCHVGPKVVRGRWYEVDHDLIAAGHPRLEFEFSAALANLPPHWDPILDQERQGRETNSRAFHFDAWKHGQVHAARAQLKLRDHDVERQRPVDLSRYDCFACHHPMRGEGSQTGGPRLAGAGTPRESLGALRGAWAIFAARAHAEPTAPAAADPYAAPWRRWLDDVSRPDSEASRERDAAPHVLQLYLATLQAPEARSWDATVGLNLALRAWLADVDPQATSPLAAEVHVFDDWLAASFPTASPNRYQSPSRFRPLDPAFGELLERLQQGITRMGTRP